MNAKDRIRLLTSREEGDAFRKTARYCFNDPIGWSDRMFPLRFGDRAWGCFNGEIFESGLITRSYEARVFSTWQKMSGISFVQSLPEHRNKDNVSELMKRALVEERSAGMVLSTLYPFKFGYYEKFGYGYVGGPLMLAFQPDDLNPPKPTTGELVPFEGKKQQLDDMAAVTEEWVSGFSLGIRPRLLPEDAARDEIEWSKDRIVLYYEGGECRGFIRVQKIIVAQFVSHLDIRKIAWKDTGAFLALMHFIKKHRDQIKEVKWSIPPGIPLWLVMKEPRVQMTKLSDWMARPLDLVPLLERKASGNNRKGRIRFSIEDQDLPDNTGTYTIEGEHVSKTGYTGVNPIPLPVLSSLLFGGYSLRDARFAGKLGSDFPADADDFFGRDSNIYMSEHF